MFKHNVQYKDFNGNERKEDLYFHLSLPELTRIEAEINTDLQSHIKELTANNRTKDLLDFIERIMLSSYGQKTMDGKSFHKSKEIREAFEYSHAYAEIFEQVITVPDLARKFGENVADDGQGKKNTVTPNVVNDGQ